MRQTKFGAMALLVSVLLILSFCSRNSPGPLEGKWQVSGIVPMVVEFRDGESESFGVIEKVTYEVRGNDAIVHSESGLGKGVAVRYTMTGPDSARAEFGTLTRIKQSSRQSRR